MTSSSPFTPPPVARFSTTYDDTIKILKAVIAYLDHSDGNTLAGNVEALHGVVSRESSENPSFWNDVGAAVVKLYESTPVGTPYTPIDVGVPLFNRAIAELSISALETERAVLWYSSGAPRRGPGRTPGPPPSKPATEAVAPPTDDDAGDLLLSDDEEVEPTRHHSPSPAPIPRSAKGKNTPRQDQAQVIELAKAAGALKLGTILRPSASALLDSRVDDLESNPPPGAYSPLRTPAKKSSPPRPSKARAAAAPPPSAPTPSARRATEDQESGSEDGDGFLRDIAMAEANSLSSDDAAFVEALLAAPAEDCQLGSSSTELGRAIAGRAQEFRKLKKNTLREFVQRSNAPLPVDVREAIIRNEYVDFGKVLAFNPSTTYTQPLGDASLQLVIEAPSPSRPVTTFHDWLDVFTKVARYSLTAYPMRAEEFASYSEWFRIRATRTPALLSRYLEYDSHYRRHLGMFGYPDSLFGAATHFDLLNEVVYHPDTSHASSSSSSSRPNKRSSPSSDPRDEICRRWNSGHDHDNCQRLHVCSRCNSAEHDVRSCKKSSGSGGARGGGGKKDGNGGGAAGGAAGKSLRQ